MRIALVGSPNSGKTALFNRLTGSRHKVANYAGVTVERKSGTTQLPNGTVLEVVDLPGSYSLSASTPDEAITRAYVTGKIVGEPQPDVFVCVADSTNLKLHLRFALDLMAQSKPTLLVLNMADVAAKRQIKIDLATLERLLGVPVVETIAVHKNGVDALLQKLEKSIPLPAPQTTDINAIISQAISAPHATDPLDDKIDSVVLHPVFGLFILAGILFLMFQAVFAWAAPFQDALENGLGVVAQLVQTALPDGLLKSLLVDGVIAGVGSVIVFLPQIVFLFLFILTLEESGYLPRAAFLLDKIMLSCGLSGRAFIPLLSSFACAIPGIMAARTIRNPIDRLTTILVAPLMTCSARLPVYALLISAFIPNRAVGGLFNLQGLVLFGLYMAGIVSAMAVAFVMKKLRKGQQVQHPFMMELPSYHLPRLKDLLIALWDRAWAFLARAGATIFAISIIIWVLSTFPYPPEGATEPAINYSFAGIIGHALAPLFAPIGFTWQIVVALIPGLAAREVAVSALATVYAVGDGADDPSHLLTPLIAADWSFATAMALMVWYIYAPQCLATLAVIRRETGSLKTSLIAAGYLFGLAYIMSFLTYRLFGGA